MSLVRRFVSHRAVQFLAVGALLAALAPRERDDARVTIEPARAIEALRAAEAKKGRPLEAGERAAVLRDVVDEEILAREALRLGLATSDAVVRARLAEQMRSHVLRSLPPAPIGEAAIEQATVAAIASAPERARLAVWFVPKDQPDAERVLDAIRAAGAAAPRASRPPIPDGAVWTEGELARVVGPRAAEAAFAAAVGAATEPQASSWGFYVFLPLERRRATPAEVRADVYADLARAHDAAAFARWLERAREDYATETPLTDLPPRTASAP